MAIRWRFSPSLWLSSTERRELYWWSSVTKENRDLSIGGSSRPWETARNGEKRWIDQEAVRERLCLYGLMYILMLVPRVLIKTHHTCSSYKGPTILHRDKCPVGQLGCDQFLVLQFIKKLPLSSVFSLPHFSSCLLLCLSSEMDFYPFSSHSKFVELLSQQTVSFGNNEDSVDLSSSQPLPDSVGTEASNCDGDSAPQRRERRKWTPTDDEVMISSWLNTSKNPTVFGKGLLLTLQQVLCLLGAKNETIITASIDGIGSMTSSPSSVERMKRLLGKKQTRFNFEHAWKELRHDQKWCELATAKNDGSLKKRKCEDGGDSKSSQATENKRPPGVKAAKKASQKTVFSDDNLNKFQSMWTMRQADLAAKERLSQLSETVPLSEADNESRRVRAVERGHEM
ncbi:hypothetical protein F2Q69_00002003 [Brassica cretica]|uniref:No apical meristem-associated C-terminal domain-containing protein n=1 Tax=Brassica cretica TaxID=69181 RepID=A0A8S9PEJ9_BRACR|nr:hypothetical protein F2Q69_00002003 [Brassica cretica]